MPILQATGFLALGRKLLFTDMLQRKLQVQSALWETHEYSLERFYAMSGLRFKHLFRQQTTWLVYSVKIAEGTVKNQYL
jgi:hypothetical protein